MSITYTLKKDIHGKWRAETTHQLGNDLELAITTRKINNALCTTASVAKREGAFLQHIMCQDFYQTLIKSTPARVTSKVVETQHIFVDVDAVINDAKNHYNLA